MKFAEHLEQGNQNRLLSERQVLHLQKSQNRCQSWQRHTLSHTLKQPDLQFSAGSVACSDQGPAKSEEAADVVIRIYAEEAAQAILALLRGDGGRDQPILFLLADRR